MAALHLQFSQERLLAEIRAVSVGGVKLQLSNLKARRIDVNCPDASDGPLHVALDAMNTPRANTILLLGIVRDLLSEGVDAQAERNGRAPFDIVKQIPNPSVVEIIERILKTSLSQSAVPSSPLSRPPTRRSRKPAIPTTTLPGSIEEAFPAPPREKAATPSPAPTEPERLPPIFGVIPPQERADGFRAQGADRGGLRKRQAALPPRKPEPSLLTVEPREQRGCCPDCCITQ